MRHQFCVVGQRESISPLLGASRTVDLRPWRWVRDAVRHVAGPELTRRPQPLYTLVVILEIRAAEGGKDAKLLVVDQATIYAKLARRRGL